MALGIFQAAFSGGAANSNRLEPESFMSMFSTGGGRKTKSGASLDPETAKRLSAVYGCRKGISESMSLFDIEIIKQVSKNKKKVLHDHPAKELFNLEVNPLMSASSFFKSQQLNLLDEGNAFAEIQFEKGSMRPVGLWPIHPRRVKPIFFYDENAQEMGMYYEVTTPDGDIINISRNRILHVVGMSENGFVGEGVLQSAANAMGLNSDLESYASQFFTDGSSGGGYVTIPKGMDPKVVTNLRNELEKWNSGLSNANRFKFLYDDLKYTPDSVKPEQAQFLESRTFQVQEIARFYGMPLHKIQENSKGSYNSYEQLAIEFVTYTLQPWVKAWEQEIQRKLFRDSSDSKNMVRFNLSALLRGDSAARSNYYRSMIFAGLLTQNEARAMEDLSAVKGADNLLAPTNLTLLENLGKEDSEGRESGDKFSDKELDGKQRTND